VIQASPVQKIGEAFPFLESPTYKDYGRSFKSSWRSLWLLAQPHTGVAPYFFTGTFARAIMNAGGMKIWLNLRTVSLLSNIRVPKNN
jgi:hypothetical protein